MLDVGKLHVEQTLQGILSMVQFGFGQEFGVARDVGDDEVAFVCHGDDLSCFGSPVIKCIRLKLFYRFGIIDFDSALISSVICSSFSNF